MPSTPISRLLLLGAAATLTAALAITLSAISSTSRLVAVATALSATLLFFPRTAIAIFVLSDAFVLLAILAGPGISAAYSNGMGVLALWAVGLLSLQYREVRARLRTVILPFLLLMILGMLFAMQNISLEQTVIGMKLFFLPLVIFVAAPAYSGTQVKRVLIAAGVAVSVSNIVALWQISSGTAALVNLGLQYGGSVRTIDSILRPPGLFVASYVYGGFASIVAVLMITSLLRNGYRRSGLLWALLSVSSVLGVVFSTSRFALIVLVIGLLAAILSPSRLPAWSRILLALAGVVAAFGFSLTGVTGTESLDARLALWSNLLAQSKFPIGDGWGSAGAASLSQFSTAARIADSYYLSLILQLGLAGIAVIAAGWSIALRQLWIKQSLPVAWAGACALIGLMASFALTESWEYTGAASLAMLAFGSTSVGFDSSRGDRIDGKVSTELV